MHQRVFRVQVHDLEVVVLLDLLDARFAQLQREEIGHRRVRIGLDDEDALALLGEREPQPSGRCAFADAALACDKDEAFAQEVVEHVRHEFVALVQW